MDGQTASASVIPCSVTDACISTINKVNRDTFVVKDVNNDVVTSNYQPEYVDGELYVDPRPIAIAASNAEKVYDDTPLVSPDYSVESKTAENPDRGLLPTHDISELIVEGSQTDAGQSANRFKEENAIIIRKEGGENVTRNYSVSYVEGTLTVNPRPITITAKGAEKVYDDTPLVNEQYEVQQEGKDCGLLAKHDISELRTNGTIINKGETPRAKTQE